MLTRVAILAATVLSAAASVASGVVLCAKQRADGTFNSSVKIREACQGRETELDPAALGLQGPAGERGPSDGFTDVEDGPATLPASANWWQSGDPDAATPAVVAEISLPAGSYVIRAKAFFANKDCRNPASVACGLEAGTAQDSSGDLELEFCDSRVAIVSFLSHEFPEAGTVRLGCIGNFHPTVGQVEGRFIRIDAIRVGTLSVTDGTP
jgi:hypothetical protein